MEEVQRLYISVDKDPKHCDDTDAQIEDDSFTFTQNFTLALSSALLCLLPLLSDSITNYHQKVLTTVSLMVALLVSYIALQAKVRRPQMARTLGYVAVYSLLLALCSLVSTFLRLVSP